MVFNSVNEILSPFEPWQIVIATGAATVLLLKITTFLADFEYKKAFFRSVRKLPFVEAKVQSELNKMMEGTMKELKGQTKGIPFHTRIPEVGWNREKTIGNIKEMMSLSKYGTEDGGEECDGDDDGFRNPVKSEIACEAYSLTAYSNPLNPDSFPGIRKMEAEIVRMGVNLFHGGEDACGTTSSGGTESLTLACKAYRDLARAEKGIKKPNIVMPVTGHVAVDKAGHLFGIEVRHVPVDQVTMLPDLEKYEKAIDANTCMVLASSPHYPQGTMDPIEEIAAIAVRHGVPMHVDACLGGFLIVFMEDLGYKLPPFDFRVKGVTSISADCHKFGYPPKGSSLIMYSSHKYIHHQYHVATDWTGGIYITPTMAGTRSGGIIAATWATFVSNGMEGYRAATKAFVETCLFMAKGINETPGLRVLGNPMFNVIAFASDDFHVFSLADKMKAKGWLMGMMQNPTCGHIYLQPWHIKPGVKERLLKDIQEVAKELMEGPKEKLEGRAAIYGMAQSIPDRGLVEELALQFLDAIYSTKD